MEKIFPETRVPSDIVKALLHLCDQVEMPAETSWLHGALWRIKETIPGADLLMKDFAFEDSRGFPYSETINIGLDRLHKAGLVFCCGAKLDSLRISETLAADRRIKTLFSPKELAILRAGARLF